VRCLYWQGRYDEAHAALHTELVDPAQQVMACCLRARIALKKRDPAAAGAAATHALAAARAIATQEDKREGDDGPGGQDYEAGGSTMRAADRQVLLAAAHTLAGAVQAAVGDADALRAHVAAALRSARAAHSPLRAVRARLTLLDGLARLSKTGEARALAARMLRPSLTVLPPLLRARVQLTIGRAGLTTERAAAGRVWACGFVRSNGVVGLDEPAGEALDMDVMEDMIGIVRLCQEAEDEQRALAHVCTTVRERLHASGVLILDGTNGRPVAVAGAAMAQVSGGAQRAIESGLAIPLFRTPDGLEAAAPVRYGAATIGALAARWAGDALVDADRAGTMLTAAAAACGATLRVAIDRRAIPQPSTGKGRLDLLGVSAAVEDVRRAVRRAASVPFPVLIEGESGSGKELVARAVHQQGPRRDGRFCALNCAALTDDLVEAELFGHTRGAFTGALTERMGLFEEADGGTLFLDEVAELSPRAQAKLLRVIQEGEIRRVGENFGRRVDARIIAATNRPLRGEISAGRFREDLYYRLEVIRLVVPPLRDRVEDIPVLVAHFWAEATTRTGSRAVLEPDALAALARYDWPGNVRELQNVLAALAVRAPRRGRVGPACLPETIALAAGRTAATLDEARRTFDSRFIRAALARAGGHRGRAAADLGLSRQGLAKLMVRLGIEEGTVP
jgi:DNA-binding NtrC family response regulator